ncbi:MAG: TolC family protein, partial [Fibrobacteres bacterium]|nr:TolC family protein [Fibrobacterota bacterium]
SLITYAESIKTVIEKHVESGLLGKTELLRSVKDITLLEMERGTLAREYDNSLNLLGTLWGANYGTVKNLSGELHAVRIIRLHDTLKSQLEMSPVLRSSLAGIEAAKAVEAENKSQGYPELMVKGGVIRDSESDVNKFTIGATIGLPIFNRNSSAVIAAGKRSEASDEKSKAVRNELNAKLIECDAAIGMLEYKANELKEKVIPQTEEVLKELRRLFAAGKSSYMELITTQRELVEAWRDYLNTETEIRLVMADIIELTGQSNQE